MESIEKDLNSEITGDYGNQEKLNNLREEVNQNFDLAEIGKFDDKGNFEIRDDIKGNDENGNYIEIKGNKYYDDIYRSKTNDTCLGYTVSKLNNGVGTFYIGLMENGMTQKQGTEYHSDGTSFNGEWKNGAKSSGFEVLSDGSTFNGNYNEYGQPINGILKKYKDGNFVYTYNGGINANWLMQGKGSCEWKTGHKYEGERKDGYYNGNGIMTYPSGQSYNGEWLQGKKNGHGIYSYKDGHTYEGDWVNDGFKEGKGIEIQKTGEKYEGDFLLDENGNPKPFYIVYNDWKKRKLQNGETSALSNIHNLEGRRTFPNGSYHNYKLTNGSLSEKSNDFITMYGDKKPDEDWSKERGNIEYIVNCTSNSHIEYKMNSRKLSQEWKFEGGYFKFKSKKGKILSIKKNSNFDERKAMHAANLINSIRYINANANTHVPINSRKYRYDKNDLYATKISDTPSRGVSGDIFKKGTVLLKDVKIHFGGISAQTLAEWLNEGY